MWKIIKSPVNAAFFLVAITLLVGACAPRRDYSLDFRRSSLIKDNKPSLWTSDHPRVLTFKARYMKNSTVRVALERGKPYLGRIVREFRRRNLPIELAFLPMIESMFVNRANSGVARGLW